MTDAKLDPITLEMFWRRLNSTVDELAATLKRTSFSTVVRDVNDYATSLTGRPIIGAIPRFYAGPLRPVGPYAALHAAG